MNKKDVLSLYKQGKLQKLDDEQTKNVISFLGGTTIYTEFAKLSTGDLVRCNLPIEMLTKARDGSGMLGQSRDKNGKIREQVRLTRAGVEAVSPLFIFQVMSMATGQYYMHNISKHLKNIEDKLSQLFEFIETDINAQKQQISNQLADYNEINYDFIEPDIDRLFRYEDFAKKELSKYCDSIDVLKNVSTELRRHKIIMRVNENYDKVIKRFVNKIYLQFILVLVYYNLRRAYTALNKPLSRISDVNNKFVLCYEEILDTYYEFQKDRNIADRFISEIMRLPRLISYDNKYKTKNMKNEFLRKKNDIVVNKLLENIILPDSVFFIEKKEDSSLCISTISNE